MHFYEIYNRITKQLWRGWAKSAQEACEAAGWLIGNCFVRVLASHLGESPRRARLKGGIMPEVNPALIKALAALEAVQAQLEKTGWEIYHFEIKETFDERDQLVLFLHPIDRRDEPRA